MGHSQPLTTATCNLSNVSQHILSLSPLATGCCYWHIVNHLIRSCLASSTHNAILCHSAHLLIAIGSASLTCMHADQTRGLIHVLLYIALLLYCVSQCELASNIMPVWVQWHLSLKDTQNKRGHFLLSLPHKRCKHIPMV